MKRILIVGGSQGIGKAILEGLGPDTEIINLSRTAPETQIPIRHIPCDVLRDELPQIEKLDGLVYCPGSINLKPIKFLKEADFRNDFEINVIGALKVIKHYLPALQQSETASVVLFSTVAVKTGMAFHSSIAASKGALEGMAKSLAAELAPKVRFNTIGPTITDTPLAKRLLRNEKQQEEMAQRHPLKHYLQPDEVAQLTQYLLGDASRSISGQSFYLDAGITSIKA
ncbi:SDR family NAD(P)-dependent oxidoreductase [Sediminicola luteus]|uniref:Oxidoreductase n=1 Tax=Sediminicola luteus TaxID=319238 RepID=A0A2A4GAK2_9FLAO|nr:SDR family oxidoreductase [Sediminicola luteus]PCE64785.1 oxidoreductase [Sediminicola luteus]